MAKKLLAAAAICAALSANAQTSIPQDPDVTIGKLDNGLTYYIRHNELPKQTASFYIVQSVGAILEEDDQNGLAHFLEHMAFNGTKNFPDKGIINFLERHGVRFGANINAYTSLDETVYNLDRVPTTAPGLVDSALLVLHDWSGHLSLEGPEIDKERGVIREEWRARSSASRRMYFKHLQNTMAGTQYAKRDVIGDTAIINNFAHDALRAYYKKWYRPDLQCIVIVGDVDVKEIENKIAEMWKDIPAPTNAAERIYYQVPLNSQPIASILTDDEATYTSIQIQLRHSPIAPATLNTEEGQRDELIGKICSNAINTRFADMRQSGAPFAAAQAYDTDLNPSISSIVFFAAANAGKTAETVECLIDEMERIRRYGINEDELQRAKTDLQKNIDNALKNKAKRETGTFVRAYCNAFLEHETVTSVEYQHEFRSKTLPTITLEDVKAYIAKRYVGQPVFQISAVKDDAGLLTADQYIALYNSVKDKDIKPKETQEIPDKLVDTEATPTTVKKWGHDKVYDARYADLANGIRVYFKPTTYSDNEIIISGYRRGGYSNGLKPEDVLSAQYAASVSSSCGLGEHKRPILSKILTGKSASVSASASSNQDNISGSCAKADFETAMQLLYLNFQPHPDDQQAFASLLDYQRTMLVNADKNPSNVFYKQIDKAQADGNPYMRSVLEVSDLDDIDYNRARQIHLDRFHSAQGFTFVIVGAFETDSILPAVLKWVGSLPMGKVTQKPVDLKRFVPQRDMEFTVKQKMTTNKTTVYIQMHKLHKKYTKKEQLAIYSLARCLDMRYLESIREDEGGSYGVSVGGYLSRGFSAEAELGINFTTDPAAYDRLRPIVTAEIEKIAKEGPLASDLDKVKKNLIKSHKESLQKNQAWLSLIINRVIYGDDLSHFEEIVESITADDVKRWAKYFLHDTYKFEATLQPE